MPFPDRETVLSTERLQLEPLREAHAAELFEIYSDPRLYRFIPQDPPRSQAALADRCRRLEARLSPQGDEIWLNWAARSIATGKCVGRVEATIQPDGTALLAYELGAGFWGQGFATEACRRVIRLLFEDYGISTIVADVDTRNTASIALLERLGFDRGARREHADFFKGSPSDEFRYTLTAPPCS